MLIPLPSGGTVQMSLPALIGLAVLRFLVYAILILAPIRVWDVWFGGFVAAGLCTLACVLVEKALAGLFLWAGLIQSVCPRPEDLP